MERKSCKVQVAVRVRPVLERADRDCVSVSGNCVEIFNHRNVSKNINYEFSCVFGPDSTQLEIYNKAVKSVLPLAMDGQNLSIFAYGPTGSGKTHTMLGSPPDPGIIPRVIDGLFSKIKEETTSSCQKWKYKVSFSYLEIYNEKVLDLLEPKMEDLSVREDGKKNIIIAGLAEKEINSFNEFTVHFGPASNNRTTAATKVNNRSSRSHSLLLLKVGKLETVAPFKEYHGKIYLIDLAGSEDNRQTGNRGIRLKESGAINKSLFVLGEVIDAINNNLRRIPYRDSKLTRLLQDSIGGSCHSLMLTTIAPELKHYYNTYCTLNFATKSRKIVNNPAVKEIFTVPHLESAQVKKRPSNDSMSHGKKSKIDIPPKDSVGTPGSGPENTVVAFSSLMRRQEEFEKKINQRLGLLDQGIIMLKQELKADSSHKTEKQWNQCANEIHEIKKCISSTSHTLKDATNQLVLQKKPKSTEEPRLKQEKEITMKTLCNSQKLIEDADSMSKESILSRKTERRPEIFKTKNEKQKEHEGEVLRMLNNSTERELKMLNTVAKKRAQAILKWREINGSLQKIQDLEKIPGFSAKVVKRFLQANFIQVQPDEVAA